MPGLSAKGNANTINRVFLENNGQLRDQHNAARNDLDFVLQSPGMNLYIGSGRLHYQFTRTKNQDEMQDFIRKYPLGRAETGVKVPDPVYDIYRLDMELLGANRNVRPLTDDRNPYYELYYQPHCPGGFTRANTYRKLIYPDIYPNVDWVLYEKEGEVKYDFILHEGARPEDIRIRYGGATSADILRDGSLLVTTPMGSVTEKAPVAWTEKDRKPVNCRFVQQGDEWTFVTDSYSGVLVLDPVLHWGTYFGGSGEEESWVRKMTADSMGMLYITGATYSVSQIATTGAYQTTIGGGVPGKKDAFLAKFHPDGSLLWASYFGGSEDEYAYGIASDHLGHVYISGQTNSSTGIAKSPGHQLTYGGASDHFLAQFNDIGELNWATYYGGSGEEAASESGIVATDAFGAVYLAGTTNSASGISTPGSHQFTVPSSGSAPYLAKFSVSGQRIWGTYFGGLVGGTECNSLATDRSGNIYLGGNSRATSGITTPGTHQENLAADLDVYVAKFDSSGSLKWGTYYGGSGTDQIRSLATDINDDVLFVGDTYSDTGIASPGASRTVGAWYDSYVVKLNGMSGQRLWGTYAGANSVGDVIAGSVSTDPCGKVYISGIAYGFSNIASADAIQNTYGGGGDGMLLRYSSDGVEEYGTFYGGPSLDAALGVNVDAQGTVCMVGYTSSTSGIATSGGFQQTYGGGANDVFLVKLLDLAIDPNFSDSALCVANSFSVPYLPSSQFNSGNVFTIELSDATGDFTNAISIGSVQSATAGTISCLIPSAVPPGNGYRIRVTASDPAITESPCDRNVFSGIRVLAQPEPTVTANGAILTSSEVNGNQWIKNNVPVNGATAQTYTVIDSGWYRVSVTNGDGCTGISDSVYVVPAPSGSVQDILSSATITVYPSPFSEHVFVRISESLTDRESYQLTVTDQLGRLVYETNTLSTYNKLDLAFLSPGTYFVIIDNHDIRVVSRLVKQE